MLHICENSGPHSSHTHTHTQLQPLGWEAGGVGSGGGAWKQGILALDRELEAVSEGEGGFSSSRGGSSSPEQGGGGSQEGDFYLLSAEGLSQSVNMVLSHPHGVQGHRGGDSEGGLPWGHSKRGAEGARAPIVRVDLGAGMMEAGGLQVRREDFTGSGLPGGVGLGAGPLVLPLHLPQGLQVGSSVFYCVMNLVCYELMMLQSVSAGSLSQKRLMLKHPFRPEPKEVSCLM